jgi:hypothetical protein
MHPLPAVSNVGRCPVSALVVWIQSNCVLPPHDVRRMAGAEPFLRLVHWIVRRRVDGSSLRALGRSLRDVRCFRDHLGGRIRGKLGGAAKPDAALRIWRIHAVHDAVGPSVNHQSVDPCLVQIGTRKEAMPTKNRFSYTFTVLILVFLTPGEMSCTSSP